MFPLIKRNLNFKRKKSFVSIDFENTKSKDVLYFFMIIFEQEINHFGSITALASVLLSRESGNKIAVLQIMNEVLKPWFSPLGLSRLELILTIIMSFLKLFVHCYCGKKLQYFVNFFFFSLSVSLKIDYNKSRKSI